AKPTIAQPSRNAQRKAVKRRVPVVSDTYATTAEGASGLTKHKKKTPADPFAKVPVVEDDVSAPAIVPADSTTQQGAAATPTATPAPATDAPYTTMPPTTTTDYGAPVETSSFAQPAVTPASTSSDGNDETGYADMYALLNPAETARELLD